MKKSGLVEAFAQSTREAGLKWTLQRKAVAEALIQVACPASIDDIYSRAECKKNCDKATVYRTLAQFETLGLVVRCDLGDRVVRYETKSKQHHHHVICRECHKIAKIDFCVPKEMINYVEKKGFAKLSHTLEFSGVCIDCS